MIKAPNRYKPIAPRPAEVPQGSLTNAYGHHMGVTASPLERCVSMNPKDYVWGTPTALPGACSFTPYAGTSYVCSSVSAPFPQHSLHHSASLPNLYPPAAASQGGNVVPQQVPCRPIQPVAESGLDVPVHAEPSSARVDMQQDFPIKSLEVFDDDMLGNLDLDILDDNLVQDPITCENMLSRADSWKVGNSDLPSDLSTATGDKTLSLNLLGDEGKNGLPGATASGTIMPPCVGHQDDQSLPINFDLFYGLEELEDTSSQIVPFPPVEEPLVPQPSGKPSAGLKRAKSEAVLKKTQRQTNFLRKLAPGDAFGTILEFLNTEDRVPRSDREQAICAIRALKESLERNETAVAGRGSKPSSGLGLLRTRSEKIPKGKRSKSMRGSPSKVHLPQVLPIDLS